MQVEADRVLTIAVTNLPSSFEAAYPHVRGLRSVRLAVGMHPLQAVHHGAERQRFIDSLPYTSYVGEIGLDFSVVGRDTRHLQEESFQFVLAQLQQTKKFATVHSRGAESTVIEYLDEFGVGPVVFHWFTGSIDQLDRLLERHHYCSVNPAMIRSARGRSIIERVPPERLLTETDGPYVRIGARPAQPKDVAVVTQFIASVWNCSVHEVQHQVLRNLRAAIPASRE